MGYGKVLEWKTLEARYHRKGYRLTFCGGWKVDEKWWVPDKVTKGTLLLFHLEGHRIISTPSNCVVGEVEAGLSFQRVRVHILFRLMFDLGQLHNLYLYFGVPKVGLLTVTWSIVRYSKRLRVQWPVRAHTQGYGFDPWSRCIREATDWCFSHQCFSLSLSGFHPFKINKTICLGKG